jgi:hypothetical protein
MEEPLSCLNKLGLKLDELKSAVASRKMFLGNDCLNNNGVEIKVGTDMLVSVRINRIGEDRSGTYVLINIGREYIRIDPDMIVGVDNTPSLV